MRLYLKHFNFDLGCLLLSNQQSEMAENYWLLTWSFALLYQDLNLNLLLKDELHLELLKNTS